MPHASSHHDLHRGQLRSRVGYIDEMWCHLGDLSAWAETLTVRNASAGKDAPCRAWQNVLCRKADVERIIPRMRGVDLTPEKHSPNLYTDMLSLCSDILPAHPERFRARIAATFATKWPDRKPTKKPRTAPTPAIIAASRNPPRPLVGDPEKPRLKPGPKPRTLERVKQDMRRKLAEGLTPHDLGRMKQEYLAETYGASRETACKAREEVLSELEFSTNSNIGDSVGIGNFDK
jgi:hypothetical protein